MKIVSWNINGLISWIDSQSYTPIENLEPDIVCLQETRTQRRLTSISGYCHYWNPCKKNGLHGTLTATKREPLNVIYGLGVENLDNEGRVLTVECPTLFVVNCYAPRAETLERHEFRRQWDEALQSFIKKLMDTGKQIVLCGDFNALRSDIDVYPENEREHYALQGLVSEERSNLEKLLELGFVDAFRHLHPYAEGAYTWWSTRKQKRIENRGWRLDYFFVSRPAAESIKEVTHLTDITGSDHAPILIDMEVLFTDHELAEEWKHTDWGLAENTLEKLQQELTRASFARNRKKMTMLQREIVTNPLIKRLAIREVSESTNTCGIDNVRWHTAADKMQAAKSLNHEAYHASPLRQVIIVEKGSGKERHIGIPVMYDRAMHKLYDYSLKPVMEAMSESQSYGFRLRRSAFDVHENIKAMLTAPDAPEYIVRGDVKAFYASIQHQWLIDNIPMDKDILKEFLSAGHVFAGELYPGEPLGISEGSSISPTLANMVLNGLQKHIYISLGVWRKNGVGMDFSNGRMVRYADDVLFTVRNEHYGKKVITALESFLSERGLVLSPEKTYIAPADKKFTFLSRSYWKEDGILHSAPSEEAIGKFVAELEQAVSRNTNKSQRELIRLLNRKLKGWAGYHRITEAKTAFRRIDAALQGILLKNAFSKHPKMAHSKVIAKYWYRAENGRKVFALPSDKSIRLVSLSSIPLIEYSPIVGKMNPYTDIGYFENRTHAKSIQHVTAPYRPIWERQGGKCFYCGRAILPDQKRTLAPIDLRRPMSKENSAYIHERCKDNELEYVGYMGDPYGLREVDIMRLLEEVSRIKEHRKHNKISYLKERWQPGDPKWSHVLLKRYIGICIEPKITLTFKQIEQIEGRKLHPASKREDFWSEKKKSYKTIADTWKSEGYELASLDLKHEKITLRRIPMSSLLYVPDELTKQKLPEDAMFELNTFFKYIIDKYGLQLPLGTTRNPSTIKGCP